MCARRRRRPPALARIKPAWSPRIACTFSGAALFNCIGPIPLPEPVAMWHLALPEKKDLHGPARYDVGGMTPGIEPGTGRNMTDPNQPVPVVWHGIGPELVEELQNMLNLKAWIDLTATGEVLALVCNTMPDLVPRLLDSLDKNLAASVVPLQTKKTARSTSASEVDRIISMRAMCCWTS